MSKFMSEVPRSHLRVAEAALALGVSEKTIYRLIKSGALPATQIGGKRTILLIPVSAIYGAHCDGNTADSSDTIGKNGASSTDLITKHSQKLNNRRGPKPKWQRNL